MQTRSCRSLAVLTTLAGFIGGATTTYAQFPPKGDDITQSLAQFRIVVNPTFQPMMAGNPYYNPATKHLTSPVLYDQNTTIGRSDVLHDGASADVGGVPVGTAGTIVSESMLTVLPGGLGPAGTREVHTEIRSMNMTDISAPGVAVRAGTDAPAQPGSFGEVESWSGATGTPAMDFPAHSFFDIFCEVDLPSGGGFPGATMYNDMPLLIQNTNLTSFPPQVVYIHGMSTAVPIKFRTANPPNWNAGDTFGILMLAGHGVFSNDQATATADLENALNATPEAPVEPQYAGWAPGLTMASASMIFGGQGDDLTYSLGMFRLAVNPAFQSLMSGYPGWNASTRRLTSPLLFDSTTKIGRSGPLQEGSAADTGGVPVGSANTIVANNNLTLFPPNFSGPNGTREVHTEVRKLNMTGGGAAVRAGTAATGSPGSYGEVESLSGNSGDPYWDFPAKSFFDLWVQVDVPNLGGQPLVTLVNTNPMIVQDSNLTNFPPKVIYTHGNSTAVPVAFKTSNLPAWHAGDIFGVLLLAGHGINFTNNTTDVAQFQQAIAQMSELPVAPQYITWAPNLTIPLQISTVNLNKTGGLVQITGYATPGLPLFLQQTPSLVSPTTWQIVGSAQSNNTNGFFSTTANLSPTAPAMFYRMVDPTR
ncbi:MAG: hypothetical protein C5B50_14330 [Verrucomicrobia bacterium]|nr:MAG: hypothetical protein C5B50_14330 [Verrucomicrobiota bacterium]